MDEVREEFWGQTEQDALVRMTNGQQAEEVELRA